MRGGCPEPKQLTEFGQQLTVVPYLHYPVAIIGTIVVVIAAVAAYFAVRNYIDRHVGDPKEHYRKRQVLSSLVVIFSVAAIGILWARLLQHTGTFLGIVGAGLAIALRDPLLSIAGRIAISAGGMYSVGDRIELDKMKGDVIDVGFFYTRMMEVGAWIGGDQVSGRIVQLSNSRVFGTPVFNYTQNFAYIWDEITLPITYTSNLQAATKILLDVGGEYSREFLTGAEAQLREMERYFVVPAFELKPNVYVKVTSNWLELTMRYVVEPKKRRNATTFIYTEAFKRVQASGEIRIASETMDLTVRSPKKAA